MSFSIENPFRGTATTNYEDFCKFPLYETEVIKGIKSHMATDVSMIGLGKSPYTRLICLGYKGVGKSSVLYYIKRILDEAHIKNVIITTMPETLEALKIVTQFPNIDEILQNEYIYVLLDHPDEIREPTQVRNFLATIWKIMSVSNLNQKIQLVFAMNRSHYAEAYNISEIMGKFQVVRFKTLTREEVVGVINSRLVTLSLNSDLVFEPEVIDLILQYTQGIARNVLAICFDLFDKTPENQRVTRELAMPIIEREYPNIIIQDRTSDDALSPTYKEIIELVKKKPNQVCSSKEELTKDLCKFTGKGRVTCISYINDLIRWGLLEERRGGSKRTNRIITLFYNRGGDSE